MKTRITKRVNVALSLDEVQKLVPVIGQMNDHLAAALVLLTKVQGKSYDSVVFRLKLDNTRV